MPSRCDSVNSDNVLTSDWHPRLSHAVALRLEDGRCHVGIELRTNALQKTRTTVRGACPNGKVRIATQWQAGSRSTIAATRAVVSSTSTRGRYGTEHKSVPSIF